MARTSAFACDTCGAQIHSGSLGRFGFGFVHNGARIDFVEPNASERHICSICIDRLSQAWKRDMSPEAKKQESPAPYCDSCGFEQDRCAFDNCPGAQP